MNRPRLAKDLEASVLLQSRRRCCICYGLRRDAGVKRGQIAHLDRSRENNRPDNLVFLCLEHHDEYDSRTSQSKNLTATEVKVFRAELQGSLAAALRAPLSLAVPDITGHASWVGLYRKEGDNTSAEIEISFDKSGQFEVSGLAFWGKKSLSGPHTGEIEASAILDGDQLKIEQGGYELVVKRSAGGIVAIEPRLSTAPFGLNVTFEGAYDRVPAGADVLPQAPLRPFESEFWPEEGCPVFVARTDTLELHARPISTSPMVAQIPVARGGQVKFQGYRYRTLRPGTVIVKRDTSISGRNLGQTDYISQANYYHDGGEEILVQLSEGSQIEYLQYRAEGCGFVRWQGLVIDIEGLPWLGSSEKFEFVTSPVAESWVQVCDDSGKPSGWVLADEELEEISREF